MLVYTYCLCWCDLDQIQGQGHGAFELPTIAHNCTFPCLRHFCVQLKTRGCWWYYGTWTTAYLSPLFEFPCMKAIMRVQTSPNIHISRHSNSHSSVLRDATVRWLGVLVVLQLLCMLMWPWPDPRSRSRSRAFELQKISEAVHACWRRWPWALFRGFLVVFLYMGCALAPPGKYDWTICVQRRCGLMSNYFDDLFWLND